MIEKLLILIVMSTIGISTMVPSPQELTTYFREGQSLFVIEDYDRAIGKYERIVETESSLLDEDQVMVTVTFDEETEIPVKLAATYQLGNAHKRLSHHDEAVTYFRRVVEEAPGERLRSLAQYQIITTRYQQEAFDQSVEESQRLLDLFPGSQYVERAYYNMGWAHYRAERYEQAVEAFSRQLENFPQGDYAARAQYQIAQSYYDAEDYDPAIEGYQAVIDRYTPEEFSEQEWSQALLGRLRKRSQTESSVLKGQEEQSLVELSAKAQLQIGECHNKEGRLEEAIGAYRKVAENFLPLTDLVELAYLKMAETAFEMDGLEAAVKIYREGLDKNTDRKFQAKMQYKIAKLYFQHDEFVRAAEEYQIFIDGYAEEGPSIGFSPDQARYSVGLSYYQAKRYEQAIEAYQRVPEMHPDSYMVGNALYGIGLSHQMLENREQSETVYRRVVEELPDHDHAPLALLQLARLLGEQERYEEARESYQALLETYPESPNVRQDLVLYELGLTCRDMGRPDEAGEYLGRIPAESDLFAAAVTEINEIYIEQGNFEAAEKTLSEALERSEDTAVLAQIRYARARLYVARQDYQRALEDFTFVIDNIQDDNLRHNAIFARGVIHFQFERYDDAIADLELLMTLDADPKLKKEGRQKLGICYLKTGQKDRAIALARRLEESATTPAQRAEAYLIMADLYYELREYRAGIGAARKVLDVEEADGEIKVQAYYTIGNCHNGLKEYAGALEAYTAALERFPDTRYRADLIFQAGIMSYNLEDYNGSAERFEQFTEGYGEHPNRAFALYYLAYSHFRRGLWPQAREAFSGLAAQYPTSEVVGEARYQVAECYYNERDYDRAQRAYRVVLQQHPDSPYAEDALYNIAWCQFQLEREDEAVATLAQVVARFPGGDYAPDAQFTIGDHHYNRKEYDQAREAYQAVIDQFPEHPRARQAERLIHELGQITSYLAYQEAVVLFDEKKYLAAIEAFERIIEQYPGTDVVVGSWANIGASYEQLSRWSDALEVYDRVIELYSDDPEHQDAVAFATEHKTWIEETF
jgi:tetratricopeptide (TPR) repeat protein